MDKCIASRERGRPSGDRRFRLDSRDGAGIYVVFMGRLISFLEKKLRGIFPKTSQGERTAGAIMAVAVPLISAGAGFLLLYFAWRVHPWAYFALSASLCWQCFAAAFALFRFISSNTKGKKEYWTRRCAKSAIRRCPML